MQNKKMKIGILIDVLIPAGLQASAIEEVRNLRKLGHEARLLVLMRRKYEPKFKYLVKEIPYQFLSDSYPRLLRKSFGFPILNFFSTLHLFSPLLASRVIKKKEYDLLISHGTTTSLTALCLRWWKKIPYVTIIYDPISYILKKVYSKTLLRFFFRSLHPLCIWLEGLTIKAAFLTIIVSTAHLDFIKKTYHMNPVILSLGTHCAPSIPNKRGPLILATSRWQKEKNPQLLLELVKEIPQSRLKIAGMWTCENDFKEFKNLIEKYDISDRVKIIPQFSPSQLPTFFREARVWVHPNFEAFGMDGLQAAAQGVPIVIPKGSGVATLFKHGEDGFFPNKATADEFMPCVKKLLYDERLAWKMGYSAWSKVRENYTWEKHTQELWIAIEEKFHD